MPFKSIGAASILFVLSGTCLAQDRVTTYWDDAISGIFGDESLWSNGLPFNTKDTLYDLVIDATGNPYTIDWNLRHLNYPFTVESLTLNSADATLKLSNRNYGMVNINESLNILAGTLDIDQSGIIGAKPNTRMNIAEGARITMYGGGIGFFSNAINNFDVYGGDLVLNARDYVDLSGTSVKEGDLIINTQFSGGVVLVDTTIDYDIHFNNTSERRFELVTHVDGLEITEGTTISGVDFWLRPKFGGRPDYLPASFINRGTIRLEGGSSRISHTKNYGVIDVDEGDLTFYGDNDGSILVGDNAQLRIYVTDNGVDLFHHNYGIVDVRGVGAVYQIDGDFFNNSDDKSDSEDYWSNSGTIRFTDYATGQFGSFNLANLGTIERDETSRIEILGRVNLDGGTINADTFHGEVWLTNANPGGSGGDKGEITGGIIDLTGNWLKFSRHYGFVSDVEFIGGDLVIDGAGTEEGYAFVGIDDITIRDGGIVLGGGSGIGFRENTFDDAQYYFNQSITTNINFGEQAIVEVANNRLHLDTDAFVSGHLILGRTSYVGTNIYNEGVVLATGYSGRLDIYSEFLNHGLLSIQDNERMTFKDLKNYSSMLVDNSTVYGRFLENHSTLEIINGGTLQVQYDFELSSTSELTLDAIDDVETVKVYRALILGGILNLDLSAITEDGIYQLLVAQTFTGEFDAINISGLRKSLEFAGFDATTGAYTIIPAPMSTITLAMGVLATTRRRR